LGDESTIYYFEVPFDSQFYKSKLIFIRLLFNPIYKNTDLVKSFIKRKKDKTPRMNEHINFFTPMSLEKVLQKNGFAISETGTVKIDCERKIEKVIYAVCKQVT